MPVLSRGRGRPHRMLLFSLPCRPRRCGSPTAPIVLLVVCLAAVRATAAGAPAPDADRIARITDLTPEVRGGIVRVTVPRGDLAAVVDGVRLQPFQGLTSWAAFTSAGGRTLVMGDLTLAEPQVNPALSAALDNGLEVTALHNHFFYDRPHLFFMHIGGVGTTEQLATAVRRTLDAARAAGPAAGFGGPTVPAENTIDPAPLEAILRASPQTRDGMAKFSFSRTTSAHDADVGEGMGVNTWAVFAGSPSAALVDGDFAMLEDELQDVLKALRRGNINVVAIHNHMTHEDPRIMFLHFWGKGPADDLARTIKSALDVQGK